MKTGKAANKTAKKSSSRSPQKTGEKNKKTASRTQNKQKSFLKDVLGFRWLKKAMVGKTQEESLDLLDQWILKKKALALFF